MAESSEFVKLLGDDYGPIVGPHGRLLAGSAGRIDYAPGGRFSTSRVRTHSMTSTPATPGTT